MTAVYTDDKLGAQYIARDDQIVRWLRHGNEAFEPVTTAWMLDRMKERPNGAYVDVGASTGWFAVPMAKQGYRVIAFECNARAAQRLKDNCVLNDVHVELHEAAASDHAGTATFTHNPRLPLTSGGSLEYVRVNTAQETVPCLRLDDVIDRPVSLLKIDVEGHEAAVLRGAETVLAASRPALVLEANDAAHERELVMWCDEHRYSWTRADKRNLLCLP